MSVLVSYIPLVGMFFQLMHFNRMSCQVYQMWYPELQRRVDHKSSAVHRLSPRICAFSGSMCGELSFRDILKPTGQFNMYRYVALNYALATILPNSVYF